MSSSRRARQVSKRTKPNWTAIGFVLAFALSTVTIVFTGLMVGAPKGADTSGRPRPEAAQAEPQQNAPTEVERDDRSDGAAMPAADSKRAEREQTPWTAERQ